MPLNSIWEGSGNVMCLDVLRAMGKRPRCLEVLAAEVAPALGRDACFDAFVGKLKDSLTQTEHLENRARQLTQGIALAVQGALLLRFAPDYVAEAFCASRLAESSFAGGSFGNLPGNSAFDALVKRAWPQ